MGPRGGQGGDGDESDEVGDAGGDEGDERKEGRRGDRQEVDDGGAADAAEEPEPAAALGTEQARGGTQRRRGGLAFPGRPGVQRRPGFFAVLARVVVVIIIGGEGLVRRERVLDGGERGEDSVECVSELRVVCVSWAESSIIGDQKESLTRMMTGRKIRISPRRNQAAGAGKLHS